MGLAGILLGLALLVWLAYRGWSILLLAPGAALIAAAFAGGPLLAYWTQTFMDSASRFIAQFFPLFLRSGAWSSADGYWCFLLSTISASSVPFGKCDCVVMG